VALPRAHNRIVARIVARILRDGMPEADVFDTAKHIDGRLPTSLIGLTAQVTGAVDLAAHRSLAARDLLRGDTCALPSGEAVADLLGVAPLTAAELGWPRPGGTPLWFHALREAEHRGGGDRLGPARRSCHGPAGPSGLRGDGNRDE
jgi:hypothetical protein